VRLKHLHVHPGDKLSAAFAKGTQKSPKQALLREGMGRPTSLVTLVDPYVMALEVPFRAPESPLHSGHRRASYPTREGIPIVIADPWARAIG